MRRGNKMANFKLDISRMEQILNKTVDAINNSKKEIYDIAESARKECKNLEAELENLKKQVRDLIERVRSIEDELKASKKKLMLVNKNYDKFSEEELKKAYEKADNLRIELAVKREQEQFFIKRRNDLEKRLKEAYRTVERADNLMTNVGVAMGFLCGDLQMLSSQLEGIQQRQLLGVKIIKAQEEERQRVARDIHDGPAQSMSNVVLKAEICEKLIDVDLEKSKYELQQLKRIVRECLQDVRKIIYNLRPMSLDDLGLIPTLERYIATFNEESGIKATFKTRGHNDELKSIISLTVFRLTQEALNNIRKHADAKNAVVSLEFLEDDRLMLHIFDDGKGFKVEKSKNKRSDMTGGFGLISMRERVELLNGELTINSEPGKGTRLSMMIPLTQEEGDSYGKD
jgi:two-component system sensor histidine kinase DegS